MRFVSTCVCVLLFVLTATLAHSDEAQETKQPKQPPRKPNTIALIVDYGDGVETHFSAIPWKEGMTINDALGFAAKHRHGISFKARGKGATALLHRIDDLENQGGGGLNWIFRVNGKLGDRSYAVTPLDDGDRVLWKFDEYR